MYLSLRISTKRKQHSRKILAFPHPIRYASAFPFSVPTSQMVRKLTSVFLQQQKTNQYNVYDNLSKVTRSSIGILWIKIQQYHSTNSLLRYKLEENEGRYNNDNNGNSNNTNDTTNTDGDDYIEKWQKDQIKPADFYDQEAKLYRHYFYTIDLQGRLFLEESRVKNIATSLKDSRFLSFFFKRLKLNTTGKYEVEYPFVSPCGKEMNYIRPADMPIVFTSKSETNDLISSESLLKNPNSQGNGSLKSSRYEIKESGRTEENSYLEYNNSGLKVAYRPENLRVSSISGKLYYKLPNKNIGRGHHDGNEQNLDVIDASQSDRPNDQERKRYPGIHYGLLKSQLVLELEKDLFYGETVEDEDVLYMQINEKNDNNSGTDYSMVELSQSRDEDNQTQHSQQIIQIETLPVQYEPFYGLLSYSAVSI